MSCCWGTIASTRCLEDPFNPPADFAASRTDSDEQRLFLNYYWNMSLPEFYQVAPTWTLGIEAQGEKLDQRSTFGTTTDSVSRRARNKAITPSSCSTGGNRRRCWLGSGSKTARCLAWIPIRGWRPRIPSPGHRPSCVVAMPPASAPRASSKISAPAAPLSSATPTSNPRSR